MLTGNNQAGFQKYRGVLWVKWAAMEMGMKKSWCSVNHASWYMNYITRELLLDEF